MPPPFRPVPPTAVEADSLIRDGETHFAHLWQLTSGGQNAEAYWSGDGTKLIWQWTNDAWRCDQEYVMDLRTGARTRVSTGRGRRSMPVRSSLTSVTLAIVALAGAL